MTVLDVISLVLFSLIPFGLVALKVSFLLMDVQSELVEATRTAFNQQASILIELL